MLVAGGDQRSSECDRTRAGRSRSDASAWAGRTGRRTGRGSPTSRRSATQRRPRTSCSRRPRSRWRHRVPRAARTTSSTTTGACTRTSTSSSTTWPRAMRTRSSAQPTPAARVHVLGTYARRPHRARWAPSSPSSPTAATTCTRRGDQRLAARRRRRHSDAPNADFPIADFVVYVRDDAILPSRFLDDLIATQATLGVDRLQPTHISGPASGPPITERHTASSPARSRRRRRSRCCRSAPGAARDGPVTLARPRARSGFARRCMPPKMPSTPCSTVSHGVGARRRRRRSCATTAPSREGVRASVS